MIGALGRAAALARRSGLGGAARIAVNGGDSLFLRAGRPPLRARVDGLEVRGYLRHRSHLADTMRPRATYKGLFSRLLEPGMTVIDAGAHLGLFTILAARTVESVIAVEPDPYNLAALTSNTGALPNVTVVPEALAADEGIATFYATRSTIGSSLLARDDAVKHVVVPTTSVDRLLTELDVSSLLVKLNIEGAEPLALAGMHRTLERVERVAILLEVNPPLLAATDTDVGAMIEGLREQGFDVGYVDFASQQAVPLPDPLPKGHLLANRLARS